MSVSVRTVCQGGLHMQGKCPGRVLFTVYFTGKASCKRSWKTHSSKVWCTGSKEVRGGWLLGKSVCFGMMSSSTCVLPLALIAHWSWGNDSKLLGSISLSMVIMTGALKQEWQGDCPLWWWGRQWPPCLFSFLSEAALSTPPPFHSGLWTSNGHKPSESPLRLKSIIPWLNFPSSFCLTASCWVRLSSVVFSLKKKETENENLEAIITHGHFSPWAICNKVGF